MERDGALLISTKDAKDAFDAKRKIVMIDECLAGALSRLSDLGAVSREVFE